MAPVVSRGASGSRFVSRHTFDSSECKLDIVRVAEKVEITADYLSDKTARQTAMEICRPDRYRLPTHQDHPALAHNLLNARDDALRLLEAQRRRHSRNVSRLVHDRER